MADVPPAGASAAAAVGLLLIAEAEVGACESAHWRKSLFLALANFVKCVVVAFEAQNGLKRTGWFAEPVER